jgi:hypothetical protein
MHRFRTSLAALLAVGAISIAMIAPASAADSAMVRVLHASPDAPAVDVYLDDSKVGALTNVPFGTISAYLAVPAGDHNVKVYATGTTTGPVIDANVTLVSGQKYTIAATGPVASIKAQVLEDDPSPSAGISQLRVVHFSADAPAVDVAVDGTAAADAVVMNLSYPNATAYLDLPGGSYDLEIRLAGTTTVALDLDPVTTKNGTSYSAFAIGSAASPAVGGNSLTVVVAVDDVSTPSTDTVASTSGSTVPTTMLLLLAVAGFALVGSLRLVSQRVRRH